MTQEFIDDMIVRFKNGKRLHRKYVYRILWDIKRILMEEPTMVEIGVADTHTLTICGDTHGASLSSCAKDRSILRCPGNL
jgi:serine/threonine-protein phosphatase 5